MPDVESVQLMFEQEYQAACARHTDIHAHLPLLRKLCDRCDHVTEFGVRTGESSRAILSSRARIIRMYDLCLNPQVQHMVDQAVHKHITYEAADTRTVTIEPTDLLFIDTLHTYEQLTQELARHAWKVRRYIMFHDTHTFGLQDEPGHSGPGLLPAILEFMAEVRYWRLIHHTVQNNGCTVLERQQI